MNVLFLQTLNAAQKKQLRELISICEKAEPTKLMFHLSDDDSRFFLAYQGSRLSSAFAMYKIGSAFECVAATLPEERGKGLFTELLEQAQERFPEKDFYFLTDGLSPSALAVLSLYQLNMVKKEVLMKREISRRETPASALPDGMSVALEKSEDLWAFQAFLSSQKGKKNIGCCFCSPSGRERCIWGVEIKKEFRSRGFGFALIKSALSAIAASGASSVVLHVDGDNFPALSLYEKAGFSLAQSIFYYLY